MSVVGRGQSDALEAAVGVARFESVIGSGFRSGTAVTVGADKITNRQTDLVHAVDMGLDETTLRAAWVKCCIVALAVMARRIPQSHRANPVSSNPGATGCEVE